MAETSRLDGLAVECRILYRYLMNADAPVDIVASYQRAHEVSAVDAGGCSRSLDWALLRMVSWGPWFAQAADAHAGVFARRSVLRRKLVLLVAILESRGATADVIDTAVSGSRVAWVLGVAMRVAGVAAAGAAAALLVIPLRVWHSLAVGRSKHPVVSATGGSGPR